MPWPVLRQLLVFPRNASIVPARFAQRADTFVEKSILHRVRLGYDLYPQLETPQVVVVAKEETP
jgi:hypothetical protein